MSLKNPLLSFRLWFSSFLLGIMHWMLINFYCRGQKFRLSVEFFSQSTIARLHLQTMLRFPSTTVLLVLLVILSPVFCVPADKNGTVKLYHPLTCRQEMQGSRFLIFHLRMFLEVQNDKFTNQSFNHWWRVQNKNLIHDIVQPMLQKKFI